MIKKEKNKLNIQRKKNMANVSPKNVVKDILQQFEIKYQRAMEMALDLQNLGYFPTFEAALAFTSPPAYEFIDDKQKSSLLAQIQPICDRLLRFHDYREAMNLDLREWLQSNQSIPK